MTGFDDHSGCAPGGEATDYLLGHDREEWSRLWAQHRLWVDTLMTPLQRLGLGAGARVLEVGCGPGTLLQELSQKVGPQGVIRGLELDSDAVSAAQMRSASLANCTVAQGDLYTADLHAPLDFVVARWVFSFLSDPGGAVDRLAASLAPGGRLVIQDYNHDGIRIFPYSPAFDRVIEAFRSLYRERGGDLWIAGRLPGLMRAAGLCEIEVEPMVKAGGPDSEVFRWVGRFVHTHLSTVVGSGHLSSLDATRFREEWAERRAAADTVLFSPMQVTVSGCRASR